MKLPRGKGQYDILAPRIPYLKHLPTVLWHNRDMYAVQVHYNSQKSLREAAMILGYYFRREKQYDFAPYELDDHTDKNLQLVVLLKKQYRNSYHVMGCFGFDYDKPYSNIPKGWMLSWAWVHPYCRGHGHVSDLYPSLLEVYDDFYFQFPISKTMAHVVFKCGSDSQKKLLHDIGCKQY